MTFSHKKKRSTLYYKLYVGILIHIISLLQTTEVHLYILFVTWQDIFIGFSSFKLQWFCLTASLSKASSFNLCHCMPQKQFC